VLSIKPSFRFLLIVQWWAIVSGIAQSSKYAEEGLAPISVIRYGSVGSSVQ